MRLHRQRQPFLLRKVTNIQILIRKSKNFKNTSNFEFVSRFEKQVSFFEEFSCWFELFAGITQQDMRSCLEFLDQFLRQQNTVVRNLTEAEMLRDSDKAETLVDYAFRILGINRTSLKIILGFSVPVFMYFYAIFRNARH